MRFCVHGLVWVHWIVNKAFFQVSGNLLPCVRRNPWQGALPITTPSCMERLAAYDLVDNSVYNSLDFFFFIQSPATYLIFNKLVDKLEMLERRIDGCKFFKFLISWIDDFIWNAWFLSIKWQRRMFQKVVVPQLKSY